MGWPSKSWNKIKSGANNYWNSAISKPNRILLDPKGELFGDDKKPSVDQASTLTPEQQAQLSALSAQNIANYPQMFSTLGSMAYNPKSFYRPIDFKPENPYQKTDYTSKNVFQSTDYNPTSAYESVANWEHEFQNDVINPAMRQMNQNIAASRNRNNLHSRAAAADETNIRQNTADNISGQRYSNLMAQQQMKMQGQESALGRGLQHLTNQANLQQQGAESSAGRELSHLTNQANLHQQGNESYQNQLYNYLTSQQGLRYQDAENSYQRQLSALGALSNLSGQALGVNGVENIVTPKRDWLDYLNTGINTVGALK